MADVTFTAANVQKESSENVSVAELAEAVTAGQSVFKDADDGLLYLASGDSVSAGAKPASGDEFGVALAGGSGGQSVPYIWRPGDKVAFGASTFTAGQWYVVSAASGGIAPASDLVASVNEVQSVTVNTATTGTFTLTFDGQTTAAIAYNATAADVEAALEALSNIDAVACTGGPLNTAAVSVEFQGVNAAKDVVQMTATNSTDGTVSISTTTAGVAGDYSTLLGYAETSSILVMHPKRSGVQLA